jgi:ADP-ribose pyrophosphatase
LGGELSISVARARRYAAASTVTAKTEPPLPLVPPTLAKWRRVREEPMSSYRVFDVSRVTLQDGAGRDRGDAFIMRCRDWCNVLAITPNDEVVLIWQYRFGSDAMSLEIPGGVIDAGETPEHAALRELREETGYEAERVEPLVVVEPNPAMQDNRFHAFVARGARPTAVTKFDAMEELETVLLPLSRLEALLDGGQVTHSLVHVTLETYLRKHGRPR